MSGAPEKTPKPSIPSRAHEFITQKKNKNAKEKIRKKRFCRFARGRDLQRLPLLSFLCTI